MQSFKICELLFYTEFERPKGKSVIMKLIRDRILKDGKVYPGGVLKVDSFLNHQIDADLLSEAGKELYRLFGDEKITKIVTVEASGNCNRLSCRSPFRRTCGIREEEQDG